MFSASTLVISCGQSTPPPVVVEPTLEVPKIDGGTAASTHTPENGVRFGRVKPKVGDRWSVSVSARSNIELPDSSQPQGSQVVQVSEYISEFGVEVLAVEGPAPSRVQVVFSRNVISMQGVDRATQIDGKTYVVDRSSVPVRDSSGSAPSGAETERVLDVFPDLGTRTEIDQVLPESAMSIGEDRHELAAALLKIIHPRLWTLNKGTAVLVRVDQDRAVFRVELDATSSSTALHMIISGEAFIRIRDSRLMAFTLGGLYEPPKAQGVPITAGSFSVTRRVVAD